MCVCVCAQLCPTLCDHIDCSLPGSSVFGTFQARILEGIAISFSRGSSRPRDQSRVSHVSCTASGFFPAEPLGKPHKLSIPFSHSVVSNSLWPHRLQHARLPCPSPLCFILIYFLFPFFLFLFLCFLGFLILHPFLKDFFDVDHFKSLYWICYNITSVFMFWLFGQEAWGISVLRPGIKPALRQWKVKS